MSTANASSQPPSSQAPSSAAPSAQACTWLLNASNDEQTHTAMTTVTNDQLVFRAVTKWLIRGSASSLLAEFWNHVDPYNNKLEDAILDQLITQAEQEPEDPQITNIKTPDYSIDITVHAKTCNPFLKTCKMDFVLYVYFHGLKQKVSLEKQSIDLLMMRAVGTHIERVYVSGELKTPAPNIAGNKHIKKRSSKITPRA